MESEFQKKTVKKLLDAKKLPYADAVAKTCSHDAKFAKRNMRRIIIERNKPKESLVHGGPLTVNEIDSKSGIKPIEPLKKSLSKTVKFHDIEATNYFPKSNTEFISELEHIKTSYTSFVNSKTKKDAEDYWKQLGSYKYGQLITKLLLNPEGTRAAANKDNLAVKLVQEKIEELQSLFIPYITNKLPDNEKLIASISKAEKSIYTLPLNQEKLAVAIKSYLDTDELFMKARLSYAINKIETQFIPDLAKLGITAKDESMVKSVENNIQEAKKAIKS